MTVQAPTSAIAQAPLGREDLQQLLRTVNETTERLQATHEALQREVARLKGELAEANAQLRRSRQLAALGEMAAGIAHEVRNPLGSIRLYVQVLGEGAAGGDAELCGKIARAVETIDAIVRDVLTFARDTTVRPEPVTPRQLFDRALEGSLPLLEAAGAALHDEVDAAAPPLAADGVLMTQALGNVIRNAAEAVREAAGGGVWLSARRRRLRVPGGGTADRVVLAVRDSGPGIAPEVLERMFNPFFTTRPTGTGLGLAIVHRIVDAHGGHVAVSNHDEGGAVVELCLPPADNPALATEHGA